MMDNEIILTDSEIIKALECCGVNPASGKYSDCKNCPLDALGSADCFNFIIQQYSLDLINRLKAEIVRLTKQNVRLNKECDHYIDFASTIKIEAIKEFEKRLLAVKIKPEFPWDDFYVTEDTIKDLAKEMIEEMQQ